MEYSTRLSLPEERVNEQRPFKTGRSAVRTWLDGLPVANPAEAGRAIYQQVALSNRLPLRAHQRLAFLNQLHAYIDSCVEGLRAQYRDRELPVRGTPRRTALLCTSLLQEMALGHEIALEESRQHRGTPKRLAAAQFMATYYRGLVLRECWVIYESPPVGTWQRLHQLYQIALETGVSQRTVKLPWSRERRTPATAYKHAALAAAAGPLQLDRGDILTVWWLIGHWAAAADVSAPSDDGEHVFHLPRYDDRPPHPGVSEFNRSDDRFLITTPLLQRIRQDIERNRQWRPWRQRRPASADYPALTERLLIALAAVPARQHRRIAITSGIQGVLGISEAHKVLSHELGLPVVDSDTRERAFQSHERRSTSSQNRERDVWDMIHPTGISDPIEERLKVRRPSADGSQSENPNERDNKEAIEGWQMINISPGGYCLLSSPDKPQRARVGELMVVRETASKGRPWQLAAVRWLRGINGKGLQVGIQIVGTEPRPVMLRARMQNGRNGPSERGFVLPGCSRRATPMTVITPSPHYQPDRAVTLRYGQHNAEFWLTYCREATNHFAQWEFEYADPLSTDDDLPGLLSGKPAHTAS